MDIQLKRGLLDVCVLAAIKSEDSYGYKIIKDLSDYIKLSESTLYPVLRRLQKDQCLEIYDMEFSGRNRRYYRITEEGRAQLRLYSAEWRAYSEKINRMFRGVEA